MKKFLTLLCLILIFSFSNVEAESDVVKLSKCVDGDTARFIIKDREYSTRFLAINTPELKHGSRKEEPYAKKASNYTCNKLRQAKKIVLEYDPNSDKEDKYGRKLAWIFVDGKLLQEELVEKGYAEVKYLYGDYKYTDSLKIAQLKAKSKKLNIWSDKKTSDLEDEVIDNILDKIYKYIRKEIKSML